MAASMVAIILFVWIGLPATVMADDDAPTGQRWGITTKKNLEGQRDKNSDTTGANQPSDHHNTQTHLPETHPAPTSSESGTSDNSGAVTPAVTPQTKPERHAPQKPTPAATKAGKNMRPPAINWSSDEQKANCSDQLTNLRALFLQTRHYSIQGSSCDTAKSAAAFLEAMKTCESNCPPGLLEHSGYTQRIIRNIRYLEKLGNDRCSGSLTPAPSATNKP